MAPFKFALKWTPLKVCQKRKVKWSCQNLKYFAIILMSAKVINHGENIFITTFLPHQVIKKCAKVFVIRQLLFWHKAYFVPRLFTLLVSLCNFYEHLHWVLLKLWSIGCNSWCSRYRSLLHTVLNKWPYLQMLQ